MGRKRTRPQDQGRAASSSAPGGEGSRLRTQTLGLVHGWQRWMTAFRVVREMSVPYLDMPLETPLPKPPIIGAGKSHGRVTGHAWDTPGSASKLRPGLVI